MNQLIFWRWLLGVTQSPQSTVEMAIVEDTKQNLHLVFALHSGSPKKHKVTSPTASSL